LPHSRHRAIIKSQLSTIHIFDSRVRLQNNDQCVGSRGQSLAADDDDDDDGKTIYIPPGDRSLALLLVYYNNVYQDVNLKDK
jgi:hypothetical protein